ncbi:DNA polymerase I [Egibacter rhizosphaerae]|uniref:DNA polymerase I n=1 Tax=Egibacter rhizosphaerae TaxID=1670831 RepID=A0A411YKP1_9ACTN|nr:DNA polymerase I [Egibacter rhizosphaerae]QBI21788.1 DNA polymerase I [Egibacter rhizosphaerae]
MVEQQHAVPDEPDRGGEAGESDERPVLALLDGHSLAYRAFYALPEDLATTTGQVTNAVYGFTSMLVKLLAEHRPDRIAVAFDRGRPAQRLEILPDYKGQREASPDAFRSQVPLIGEVLEALAIPQVVIDGVEADDVIATYARMATMAGLEVLVVTGDRDVFQIVDEHVRVLYTTRGITETRLMDEEAIAERYGVEPARYPMLAALRGDPSDNIAGVPGVGDKTAAKLLGAHGDLDGIFSSLDQIGGPKLREALAAHEEEVRKGHRVALLDRDIDVPLPLDDLRMGEVDWDAVREVFQTLEFTALWERLTEALGVEGEAGASVLDVAPHHAGAGDVAAWLGALAPGAGIAVLPESDGRPPRVRLRRVALAAAEREPVVASVDDLAAADQQALAASLADPDRPLLTHSAKELTHAARAQGWDLVALRMDTELAAYVAQPGSRSYDLEALAGQYLNATLRREDGPADDGQLAMAVEDGDGKRAAEDLGRAAHAVVALAEVLDGVLAERDQHDLLDEVELPLVAVLGEMEHNGIAIDLDVLAGIGEQLADRIAGLREEVFGQAGREFNLDSPKQLQVVLFDELGLPKTKRIKTGYSTDAQALRTIAEEHPIVDALLEYREVSKLKSTYVDALPPLVDDRTGRIHPEYMQAVAVTGRLSSQHPNIQNIPIRTETGREIRQAFVAGEGNEAIVVADYSQIELRVMAHLSGDEGLLAAFNSAEDIHAQTAAMVWELPLDAVDNMLRSRIKGMTYGLAYGLSAYGLSQQLGIPPDEARELMGAYFARFPKVKGYLDGVVDQARRDGYTATLFGRRRYLPDLRSDNRQRREMAERMALNAPIQGTAADIIKMAMIAVHGEMQRRQLASRLLVQVHDELLCEAAPGEVGQLTDLLVEAMSGVAQLAVPLEVDTASGRSWYDAEKH